MRRKTPVATLALIVVVAVITALGAAAPAAADPPDPALSPAAAADARIASNDPGLFKSPEDVIVRTGVHTTTNADLQYYTYERTHRGLPVVGGDVVVVTDSDGNVLNTAVAQDSVISIHTRPTVTPEQALVTARQQLAVVTTETTPRLVVLAWGFPRLAWEVTFTGITADGDESVPTVYVDALTNAVVEVSDLVVHGTGHGFYNGTVTFNTSGSGSSFSMQDPTRPGIRCGGQNGATFTGTDDVWGNGVGTNLETACVDVMYAVQEQWDMLGSWLGRNGINGSGGGYPARVGWTAVNASWNGSNTNFGRTQDGQRQVTPIDVVAHEYGHAIFQTTPGGSGSGGTGNEKGGLNEGTGDIFGALTEHYADNPHDTPDFLVGELANLVGEGEIRNMANPAAKGHPNCWSSAIPTTPVHAAAGPLNHWFYLVSQGNNPPGGPVSPICPGGPSSVSGIGIQKAGLIFYHALLAKTTSWRYVNVRVASLNAAVNLYGANSPECATVRAAWNAVSVPAQSGEPTCGGGNNPPPPPPPPGTVYFDDFETNTGWATNGGGGDTATAGQWARANPQPTSSGGINLQLGNPVSGNNVLVTGPLAGTSAGDHDVDDGVTSIRSPLISLPSSGNLTLSFSWYLAHLNNSSSADFFRVRIVTGGTSTILGTAAGAASNRAGSWATASLSLNQFAGQTIRIQFEAADLAGASLVEAAVDDVRITSG